MSREILERAWRKERSRMSKTLNILERWQNDESMLLNVESTLSRQSAMKQLKRWSKRRLKYIRQMILKKISEFEVSENRQRKVLKRIRWKGHDKDDLPKITTMNVLEKWSKKWLLDREVSLSRHVQRVKPNRLQTWSKRWLKRIENKAISQKQTATQIVNKFEKYKMKKTKEMLLKTDINDKDIKLKCPILEKEVKDPLLASVEFVKHAAGWLDVNYKELLENMTEGKEIYIEGWSAKQVLGVMYKTVNCINFMKRRCFTYMLRSAGHGENYLRVKLMANPTPDQPGNGRISLHENEYSSWVFTYEGIANELNVYQIDGPILAKDLRTLFGKCGDASVKNKIIHYIYVLFLFEICRRMVEKTNQTTAMAKRRTMRADSYDCLPVAITFIKILDLLQREILTPADFFRESCSYNFLTGRPHKRRMAIREIDCIYKQNQNAQACNYVKELENEFNPKIKNNKKDL